MVAQRLSSDDSDGDDEESDEDETSDSETEEGDAGEDETEKSEGKESDARESKENNAMNDTVPAAAPTSLHLKKGIRPAAVKDLKIGDFAAVQFEGKIYLASTDSLNEEGTVMVKFLKNIGGKACANKFVYPVQDDISVLFDEELIGIVEGFSRSAWQHMDCIH